MSGIFGIISTSKIDRSDLQKLGTLSSRRGQNIGGVIYCDKSFEYAGYIAPSNINLILKHTDIDVYNFAAGFTGLLEDYGHGSVPQLVDNLYVVTDSYLVNTTELIKLTALPSNASDAEIIGTLFSRELEYTSDLLSAIQNVLKNIMGDASGLIIIPDRGQLIAFTNTNNLYYGVLDKSTVFSSELAILKEVNAEKTWQIEGALLFEIPQANILNKILKKESLQDKKLCSKPDFSLLQYQNELDIKRCTKCILPETMPFIRFDDEGVCNYCHNYTIGNAPRPKEELFEIVEPYRRESGYDCIVPFSGGRDSCFALHLIIKELGMKPLTYTYDWGMVTEVGQRNISRMCGELGIENVVVAADVERKRKNLAMNLKAWLKRPDLGMLNILTAGDKHFFKYIEEVKQEVGVTLNLWGVNPLEVTHFKTGFLGIEPNFELKGVYSKGALKQLRYQAKRFRAMLKSPGYFNSSVWDTLSGEYYRSFTKKSDYYHVFDYWRWDEAQVEEVLDHYGWEKAIDTDSSWRIGDGVSGFYNYVYYTVAGFTENDTFRSNQIREGQLTREEALLLVKKENQPRYDNLQWFLEVLGFDFNEVIKTINLIPKLY